MVEDLKNLANLFEKHGFSDDALKLRQQAQRALKRGLPEHLQSIAIYDRSLQEARVYRHLMFEHDRAINTVVIRGEKKRIIPIDNRVLTVFEETPNVIINNTELLERAFAKGASINSLRKSIVRLRKGLERDPKNPEILLTRQLGYLFRDPSKDTPLGPDQEAEVGGRILVRSGLKFFPDSRKVIVDGVERLLGAKERKYLEALFLNDVVTYEMLEELEEEDHGLNVKDNLKSVSKGVMMRLRRKVEPDKRIDFQLILLVPGVGYRLGDPSKKDKNRRLISKLVYY